MSERSDQEIMHYIRAIVNPSIVDGEDIESELEQYCGIKYPHPLNDKETRLYILLLLFGYDGWGTPVEDLIIECLKQHGVVKKYDPYC